MNGGGAEGAGNEFNNPWTEWRVCKQFTRIGRFIITGQSFKASQLQITVLYISIRSRKKEKKKKKEKKCSTF